MSKRVVVWVESDRSGSFCTGDEKIKQNISYIAILSGIFNNFVKYNQFNYFVWIRLRLLSKSENNLANFYTFCSTAKKVRSPQQSF